MVTAFGICAGLFVHATLSALGVSMLLLHSATAFHLVKLAGAGYLGWLGVQSLRRTVRTPQTRGGLCACSGRPSWSRAHGRVPTVPREPTAAPCAWATEARALYAPPCRRRACETVAELTSESCGAGLIGKTSMTEHHDKE